MSVLKAEKVSFSWGSSRILKEVSIDVAERSFIGIIGPNGSGKSTFLKCIYRVLKPDHGAVFLNGVDLSRMKDKEVARFLGVVAQHNRYDFDFSVQDVVLTGRAPHKKALDGDTPADYALVQTALDQVGMSNMLTRSFSSLSGGEQQRVILARALAQQAPFLILDEPTNHLDVKYQLQMMDILRNLPLTVVAAIHDLNLAAMYCDQIFVLNHGAFLQSGTPDDVLTKELIRTVYGVESEIIHDQTGLLHILYHSARTTNPGGSSL